jgi:hypothetical protein
MFLRVMWRKPAISRPISAMIALEGGSWVRRNDPIAHDPALKPGL